LVARGYPDGITCTKEAMSLMLDYHWPGNVRELVNAVEHGMILAEEKVVTPPCLPQDIRRYAESAIKESEPVLDMSDSSQRQLIVSMLRQTGGSKSEAARMLGIDRSTLWRRMQRLGLQ
jgi:DNA-binding NtrC family response regulator